MKNNIREYYNNYLIIRYSKLFWVNKIKSYDSCTSFIFLKIILFIFIFQQNIVLYILYYLVHFQVLQVYFSDPDDVKLDHLLFFFE